MLPFYKLSGAGNDFIALVRSRQAEPDPMRRPRIHVG